MPARRPIAFLRRGLQLTIDGTDPEIIERIMRIEIESMSERHKHGKHFWASIAKFGPGCGLIACLCAQVGMFRHLDGDAAIIGKTLAGALTGTLYGALMQNVFAGPIAEKLGLKSKEELFAKEIILQGVLSIQAGNNPPRGGDAAFKLPQRQSAGGDAESGVIVQPRRPRRARADSDIAA